MTELARGNALFGIRLTLRRHLPAAALLWLVLSPIQVRADEGIVDVRDLPRLQNAVIDPSHHEAIATTYTAPIPVAAARPAVNRLLVENGWMPYSHPLEEPGPLLSFKKGGQGLIVSFTQALGRPDQSSVAYDANRLAVDLPFPTGASAIIYDENRPYLNCVFPGAPDKALTFFQGELTARGWTSLSTDDIAMRWPNASADDKPQAISRSYFGRGNIGGGRQQPPIVVSLQPKDGGQTEVDIRVAPFAQPAELRVIQEIMDLPEPDHAPSFGGSGSADSDRREIHGQIAATLPVVLSFYRRELAARGWKESSDVGSTADGASLNFSTAEQTAILRLARRYDLTTLSLLAQVKPEALAARAKAKKEADEQFFKDALATAKDLMAADQARRTAQAASLSDTPLKAMSNPTTPVPLPETAENVQFDGGEGRLEFDSSASVRALSSFYRGALKPLGWKETPSVINRPNMAVLEFSKGGKTLTLTAMQMGPKVNVTAEGTGLEGADSGKGADKSSADSAPPRDLEADESSALPVPKEHTMSSLGVGKLPGTDTPIRRELEASVTADLNSVLGFYRTQLGKLGWKESADRAVIKPDQVQLAFASPDGPGLLKLGRNNDETTINLTQRFPAAAEKGNILPKAGQAKLMLANLGNSEATITIQKQAIRIAAGAGGPQAPGPTLELPPGHYSYAVKLAGASSRNGTLDLSADEAWGVMIGPTGETMTLQVY